MPKTTRASKKVQLPEEPQHSEVRDKKKRRTKPKDRGSHFETYIHKLLKKRCPDTGISGNAMMMMNGLTMIALKKICQDAGGLVKLAPTTKIRILPKHIRGACYLNFSDDLVSVQVHEAEKAVTRFQASFAQTKEKE